MGECMHLEVFVRDLGSEVRHQHLGTSRERELRLGLTAAADHPDSRGVAVLVYGERVVDQNRDNSRNEGEMERRCV